MPHYVLCDPRQSGRHGTSLGRGYGDRSWPNLRSAESYRSEQNREEETQLRALSSASRGTPGPLVAFYWARQDPERSLRLSLGTFWKRQRGASTLSDALSF